MNIAVDTDRLVHWLIGSVELEATVFHVGQYCGRWRASTAGRALASFHLVMHGGCYLHVAGQPPVPLQPRDGVFLLRDFPHFLSPDPDPDAVLQQVPMQPLAPGTPDATGLACGFFHFRGSLSMLIVDSFPDYLVLRAQDSALMAASSVFDLILAEPPGDPDAPSPLLSRLAELLFFYVARQVAREQEVLSGLLALARRPGFCTLLDNMMQDPGHDWSTDNMAKVVHMSRSSFYKHFISAAGQPPARFLLLLRMKVAAQRLHGGDTVERTAGHVGYRSHAAFTRAFKKIIGEYPGAFRRNSRVQDDAPRLRCEA